MAESPITIEDVINKFRLAITPEREKLIREAFEFAQAAHAGQKRVSGEDYIQHSLKTAYTLAEIGLGSRTVAAGLLHDVPEDTNVTLAEVRQKFGDDIANIVDGVTKLGKIRLRGSQKEYFLENLRKMFLAMAADIRVVLIKLADRLHNMETIQYLAREKQIRIAHETMEVFAPIANRLGIGEIRGRLQNLAFKTLDPKNYENTKKLEEEEYRQREQYVNRAIREIKKELTKNNIEIIDIYGRAKQLYSLFLKLQRHDMDISKVYDLAAIRIIVSALSDCYETLGIVHKKYRPLIGRIKDYISLPKPNGYQSIHTTIFGPEGKILEVQIRTKRMHDEAEFGIAAHWIYSEKNESFWKKLWFKKDKKVPEEEIKWVNQLREWQTETGYQNEEFFESLKIDFFKDHIFAFTPKGDIIDLPEGATPIDFAYAVHTEIGHQCMGAKIDGKITPLNHPILNGQVVEILISKDKKNPNPDWLRFIITSNAKSKIKSQLKKAGLM